MTFNACNLTANYQVMDTMSKLCCIMNTVFITYLMDSLERKKKTTLGHVSIQ